MKNIVILASGSGSNAEEIIKYFKDHKEIKVAGVYTNNKEAGVLERAENHGIKTLIFNRTDLYESNKVLHKLREDNAELVVLAGFLLLMPVNIISEIPTINIHPALLPNYGGKGMYGMNVHRAVKQAEEIYSGITIHKVDPEYDRGEILAQEKVEISPKDTAVDIQKKVQKLEHYHYPRVIEKIAAITHKF